MKLIDILKQMLLEDRCKRIADRKYDKPSAYKSGAIVRCRKGNIWKDLKEEIKAEEAHRDENAIQTVIDGKRDLGFITLSNTTMSIEKFKESVKKHNLKLLKIPSNPFKALIYYKDTPEAKQKAIELKNIAEKYEGFLAYNATEKDSRRIGELLGYKKEDINAYITKNKNLKEDKQLGEGKQVGTLYHYTENQSLKQIIETNTLLAPISFTRRQSNFVKAFTGGESIIVINGDKLSDNYKIRPYQDINPYLSNAFDDEESPAFIGGKNEEYEELVSKNITNLNKYIIKVIILVPDSEIESLLKEKNIPYEIKLNEDESLHKWFKRQGPSGKEGGWVDCNTCRNEGGKPKCKACGRKKGEKRSNYPSCRPTPSQCKTPGKGKKWGKTK